MTRYRSNAWARATVRKFAESTGLEVPEPASLDYWANQYERFLWITQSNQESWLRTLIQTCGSDSPLQVREPDKLKAWLEQDKGSKALPNELVKKLTSHLESDHSKREPVPILSVDVVSHGRLIGRDERCPAGQLREIREITARIVEAHGGRTFYVDGDSEMAAFDGESETLRAALEVRKRIAEKYTGLPKSPGVLLRIGLGYGRVVKKGAKLNGDGDNIAAQVMALAGAGEVYASEAFYRLVEEDAPCSFVCIGRHTLKRSQRPVRVYKMISTGGSRGPTTANPIAIDSGQSLH